MHEELAERIDDHNGGAGGTIILPNERLAALWIHELLGQISDGAWENHWYDHPDSWEDYHRLDVEVDADRDKPVIDDLAIDGDIPHFLAYDARRQEDLVDVIGGRMVDHVAQYGYPDYTEADVRNDLQLLSEVELR